MRPLVSVIVPVHNRARLLPRRDWRVRRRRAELHYLRIRERWRARVRGATST